MHRIVLILAAAAATAITISSAGATMRITADRGGLLHDYAEKFQQAQASGEAVVIDGACLSACTLVVGMLPRNQVCATSRAVLGFHAAWRPTSTGGKVTSQDATQYMMEVYPPGLRHWIDRRGGLTPRMIFLHGRELAAFVPSCGTTASLGNRVAGEPGGVTSGPTRAYGAQRARR